jgi:hypothetical protein
MPKKILVGVSLVVVALALYISARPSEFEVKRSVVIEAPAAAVYAQVSDFSKWDAWSPWAKLDPAMKKELTGTQGSIGASYYWLGNDQVGEGRMTLAEVKPPERLTINLEFLAPFAAQNLTVFEFSSNAPAETKVTWLMRGNNNFMAKAFGLFFDMDTMVGGDFERGLSSLKALAEEQSKSASPHG